jgi:hypothetical protein
MLKTKKMRNLLRLRDTAMMDEEVGRLTASTTRKDSPTLDGIALPIQDWVGEDLHVIQFWEETVDPIPIMEYPAAEMYDWLTMRLRERSQTEARNLPTGMPVTFTGLSVKAYRDGRSGYTLHEPLDSPAVNLTGQPVRIQIEYEYGFAKLGMGDRYTLRMLAQEFWALTRNDWSLYPGVGFGKPDQYTLD